MAETRLFEYGGHWLVRRTDTPHHYIYWCRPGTRRVLRKSTGRADLEEAKRELIAFVERQWVPTAHINNGPPMSVPTPLVEPAAVTPPSRSSPVVLDLLVSYVERLPTARRARAVAMPSLRVLSEFLGEHDIVYAHELTLEVQERFVVWRRDRFKALRRGGSNATINRDFSVLKAALRDAWKRGKIPTAPYILSLPSPPPRARFLSAQEATRLLEACHEPHLRRFVLLALHTLQRPSAILGLRVEQVDLARGRIDFLPSDAEQSNKRRPIVPITPTLREELARAVAESQSGFIVEWDGRPVLKVRRSFKGACRRAGLVGATPYTLRHTGATLLAAQGVSMRQIAGMLGHSTQRTTERYAKHAPEFLQDAASTLETLFGSGTKQEHCAPDARQPRANANGSQRGEARDQMVTTAPTGPIPALGTPAEPQECRGVQGDGGRPCQAAAILVKASFAACSSGRGSNHIPKTRERRRSRFAPNLHQTRRRERRNPLTCRNGCHGLFTLFIFCGKVCVKSSANRIRGVRPLRARLKSMAHFRFYDAESVISGVRFQLNAAGFAPDVIDHAQAACIRFFEDHNQNCLNQSIQDAIQDGSLASVWDEVGFAASMIKNWISSGARLLSCTQTVGNHTFLIIFACQRYGQSPPENYSVVWERAWPIE